MMPLTITQFPKNLKLNFHREINVSAYIEGIKRRVALAMPPAKKGIIEEAFDKSQVLKKLILAYEYAAPSKDH